MKRLAAVLPLLALLLWIVPATATPHVTRVLHALGSSIIVPPEWDGVWTVVDSTYDCSGAIKMVTTGNDTICAGQEFSLSSADNPYPLECSGTATATTLDATCTGGATVMTDCRLEIATQVDAVRNGNSYRSVTLWQESYVGTGFGCNLLPASCERSVRLGTRISPGPSGFCLTATRRSTWGRLKMLYR